MRGRARSLRPFLAWCAEAGICDCRELSHERLAAYQLWLGAPVAAPSPSSLTLRARLTAVRALTRWAVQSGLLEADPSATLSLPRAPRRLPAAVLTRDEAERVLSAVDTSSPAGVRDRAILEMLYSCGLRRAELLGLDVGDVDFGRGTVYVRRGKGGKARYVPLGRRAAAWLASYLDSARRSLVRDPRERALFLGARGRRVTRSRLTERLRGYLVAAGIGKPGSCHIWRHTMATLMHDRGADIRVLQELLGHAHLSTTAIYTHVSVERVREVHRRTHPAEAADNV
ncbi:MAG: tyrosine-type recombinase/integrase [Gemmatimonadaceae bacterium]|nr:tyrosine-type recombinase/integrase [Gemmatimonadaceae bacterium]